MLAFFILSHVSLYVALAFCALCLATGLYYLSELAEEYSVMTKRVLRTSLWVVIAAHVVLYLFDRFPLLYIAIGIASHLVYMQLLKTFPQVQIRSKEFIASVILFTVEHVIWYWHFVDYRTPPYDFYQLLGFFFALVWFCPAGFFVTLTVQDLSLPHNLHSTTGIDHGTAKRGQQTVGFSLHGLISYIRGFLPQRKHNTSLDL